MNFFRRSNNPNALVGIFLLVLLAVFAGPGTLPRIISELIPIFDESIPCSWLREGRERAYHQSLIGRAASSPLGINVRTSGIPNDPAGSIFISIILTNRSLGTVPFLLPNPNPNQTRFGDDGVTSGLGLVFNTANTLPPGPAQQAGVPYPEGEIRLLGPRQSCIHKVEIPLNRLPDPSLASGFATVKAYYRNTSPGGAQNVTPGRAQIFGDQGLWVGIVQTDPVTIGRSAANAGG